MSKIMNESVGTTPEYVKAGTRISPEDLDKMLKAGVVHFEFRKKAKKGMPENSGEIRDAWGTRKGTIITKIPHGGECPPKNVGYTVYFDIEKDDWRVFRSDRLIGIWDKVYSDSEFAKAYADYKAELAKEDDSSEETV